jgi:CspA family cold shock protein
MWFDKSRGYGYIVPDDGGSNVFVHHTAIVGPLADGFKVVAVGARVQFDALQGRRGPEAVRVAAAHDGP